MPVTIAYLKKNGFTIIEMAVIIIVVGLLMAAFFSLYDVYKKHEQNQGTWDKLDTIRQALGEYQFYTGHYPCPAGLALGPGDSFYGDAICPAVAPAPGALSSGGCSSQGICRYDSSLARQYTVPGTTDTVLVGAVPINELLSKVQQTKISASEITDSWGDKIVYMVTESQTTGAFNSNHGVVEIVDENGRDILDPVDSAHFALMSYGRDGEGAYTVSGKLAAPCDSSKAEGKNCQILSSKLVSGLFSSTPGADYFDDFVMFGMASASALWVDSSASPGSAYNTNANNVGLGTNLPKNTYDVAGALGNASAAVNPHNNNIKALTSELCDAAGNNCYDVNIIAGDVLPTCPAGQALTGIGRNSARAINPDAVEAECASVSLGTLNGTCATGEYLNGFSSVHGLYCCTDLTTTCHWTIP
jgi:hypothetical protein